MRKASRLVGVKRIALLGSVTTSKPEPKDVDVIVTVEDDMDLTALAKLGRQLAGHAQSRNKGADVFLADPTDSYIGRTCHWNECRPGIRASCDAMHCGHRHYLHDDLGAVTLSARLVKEPPVDLWPQVVRRAKLPEDVERMIGRLGNQ
ncbi:MAG TPA: hypothetical protein VIL33_00625 [Rhodothermia bacterium]